MISVVVLTHDREHLLRQCVERVLLRTSRATNEIVVWDNASSDGTASYLDSLRDPRFRIVHSEDNLAQSAYARAFELATNEYLVELDDDVIEAPQAWDAALLEAFRRLPNMGFLAADLEDNEHDDAARLRHHVRPHLYTPFELNGVRLLRGPMGGGCAMTSRSVYDSVGGFGECSAAFWLEDAAYASKVERAGYGAATLADLRVVHAGGAFYAPPSPAKRELAARYLRETRRKNAVKTALLVLPPVRRLNSRYRWFEPPDRRYEEHLEMIASGSAP